LPAPDSEDFRGRLQPGEHIFWTGRPASGLMLTGWDAFLIPFSLLWGGFAIFWEASVIRTETAPFFFKLWGVPFVLMGIYLVVGRFFVDAWSRRALRYAVTDKRVLILRKGRATKLTALPIDRLPALTLIERQSGRGTIRFDQSQGMWTYRGFGPWMPSSDGTPQFLQIENARAVHDQINRLAAGRGA
jgi:hypothetical protein